MQNDFGFDAALPLIRQGKRLSRRQWVNARFVFLVDGSSFKVNRAPLNKFYPEGETVIYRPHIDMVGSDNTIGTWAPSMVDLMAEDWFELTD